jgi:hypothetical protein
VSIWTDPDLPVLRAIAEATDTNVHAGFLFIGGDSDQLGVSMDPLDLIDSLLTLRDASYISFRDAQETGGPNLHLTGLAVTWAGMQALGEWPSPGWIAISARVVCESSLVRPVAVHDEELAIADVDDPDERDPAAVRRERGRESRRTHRTASRARDGRTGGAG